MAVAIILVEPENPDNIGATARAMKNMGLRDLRLVKPPADWRIKARKLAVGADPLLDKAKIFDSLKEAVADTVWVIGTTRREGGRRRAFLDFQEAVEKIRTVGTRKTAAVVFGKESKGLSNEDLDVCDWFTTIPTDPGYPSINLAQAVMIVCFSLFTGRVKTAGYEKLEHVSTKEAFEDILESFNKAVTALEYKPEVAQRIDRTFRALLKRQGLLKSEGAMIKGLSRRIVERTYPKFAKSPGKD